MEFRRQHPAAIPADFIPPEWKLVEDVLCGECGGPIYQCRPDADHVHCNSCELLEQNPLLYILIMEEAMDRIRKSARLN